MTNWTLRNLRLALTGLLLFCAAIGFAANKTTTAAQLNQAQDITANEDFTLTSDTPFGAAGVANIVNTDHAVIILKKVKPSAAIGLLADHVKINGQTAVLGQNCQVKIYGQGSIILPYGDSLQPLTVYAGQNFGGEQCSDFGLEDSNGFMNTLRDDQLNNRIRSFKLKRGYMVTFSIRSGGYGYSRCFIAAKEDLEVRALPTILDEKISSYRIFKWNDTSKKGVADAARDKAMCDALNVTTTYEWWQGKDEALAPDVECVAHHYKESWPTASACGQGSNSPHLKTNNEPRNGADEEPCDLEAILNNWEALMATGKRLCSPSSWDGSDYWNGNGFIKEFIDAIDARGWRCDIVDMHCYWPKENFGNLQNWYNTCGRPVWVSEWVWGASWNNNGAFAPGVNEAQNAAAVKEICEKMNSMACVERYYFWNAEAPISKVYNNGTLTKAGEYYAQQDPGLAYTGSSYVPTTPPVYAPSKLTTTTAAGKAMLRWYESNGELNKSMSVEYSNDGKSWQTIATIEQREDPGYYTYDLEKGAGQYRIHIVGMNNSNRYSDVITISDTKAYYLYNVGAKQWLCCGNDWGTHATVTPAGGYDVLMAEAGNGRYTIDTQLQNGNNHYLNVVDNGPWMDQTKGEWTLTEAGKSDDDQPLYLLSCNGSNLAYNGSTSRLDMSSETGVNAQWMMQTRANRLDMLKEASAENPVDATFLIVGNNFDRYDVRNSTWQGLENKDYGGHYDRNTGNQCAEKFNTTFDVYQTISDAPKGNYRLQVQGFYRNGGYVEASSKYNTGSEALNAFIYIGDYTLPLQSIFTEAGKLDVGATTAGINGKFPNNMDEAAQFFLQGLYENTIEFAIENEGDINVGIRKAVTEGNDWAIFDNFRLTYLGDPTATGIYSVHSSEFTVHSSQGTGHSSNGTIYDLQGRPIVNGKPGLRPLQKGIYVKDGKKIVK